MINVRWLRRGDGDYLTRYEQELEALGSNAKQIDENNQLIIERLWQQQLEIQ